MRMFMAGSIPALLLIFAWPAAAGIYTSIDLPEEMQYSRNLNTFRDVLTAIKLIAHPQPPSDSPIRRRYFLLEALGHKGASELPSIEQNLNYSAALIRRDKAAEAVDVLLPLSREHPENFLLLSQCAIAHFLAAGEGDELHVRAVEFQRQALEAWPERWSDLDADKKKLASVLWYPEEETALTRYRRYEGYLLRLMSHRLAESRKRKKKEAVEETLDPIFGDAKNPVRFVSEAGAFEIGRITDADFRRLPDDAVEAVKQLLIWMPRDDRLMWLLGEVYNASAMKYPKQDDKNAAIRDANSILSQLSAETFNRYVYGSKEIKKRVEALQSIVAAMPPPQDLNPDKPFNLPDENDGALLSNVQFWRALGVSFITGLAVGMFALWQVQEMRRRRQARGAG